MDLQNEQTEFEERLETIRLGGGKDKQQAQYQRGKLLARERIDQLLDKNSFSELFRFATGKERFPGDGVITGIGKINGQHVCLYAQDFTIAGGTLGAMHAKKICSLMDFAYEKQMPIIGLIDSGGARIQEGIEALHGYGEIFKRNVHYSGKVPQLSIMLGPCAGGAAYSPALSDVIFMVKRISQMFITGPKVLQAISGETMTSEELGGTDVHGTKSGLAHFVAETEQEAFDQVRTFLSYLQETNTRIGHDDKLQEIEACLPKSDCDVYNVKDVITCLADEQQLFELSKGYAKNMVTAFIRLNGETVGVVANNPVHLAGCIDINASDKGARFVRFCHCFSIPILVLEDVSGFIPGKDQECKGLLRHGAKLIYAFAEATVPKITVILRKAYGGAFVALNSKGIGADFVAAWPQASIAVMGHQSSKTILAEAKTNRSDSPYEAAEQGYIDDVIRPRDTRMYLINRFACLHHKRTEIKRHSGNMPM
ncbi:acetyl-coenzyme A carboxyl transferase alpha chain [Bacillus sp. JCM 19047]|uniref:Acyl-CoA carboxylase subunit beta n=1 Tax=Shouchella miscanthi TaxID=2598861 RepID=A0ABU6NJN0_9BACI|nr:acyl-CoA carboxylase subunit beta [Shouchella miscanthi]MED4127628.1 acyl-CoA carboxylase subunit beta [Shouchella miscanthi]GAF22434.1 acetyl-coenzyme A carboxyl transferase alpha chain [Bacillus sp. JCM 19047]